MKRKSKGTVVQEWATQITALRERLGINQAEFARRLECSAMTVSRWERGLLRPSAEHFIQFGNLGNKTEAWFFWEMAGIQASKMVEALGDNTQRRQWLDLASFDKARAGPTPARAEKPPTMVRLPLLNVTVGTHGVRGDRRSNLRSIAATRVIGAPAPWCPNPAYTSLLRVRGHSMEPLIRSGDLLAIDSFQTERQELYGKIVIASNEQQGLCVSRLRRYENFDVLEGESREHDPLILNKASGWRIVARVLWWISLAP